jgi:uncharacterized membrane protein
MATGDLGKSSTGMQPNFAALLAYVLGLITGLIFFLIEKENKFVKFHAMQSIVCSLAWFVLSFVLGLVPGINVIATPVLSIGGLVLWIILMVKAYQGESFRLPVIGEFAAQQAGLS